jgi:hypothetical protein
MAKRINSQEISIEGLICIREAVKHFKISRSKLLNAMHFYGDKSPKPVKIVNKGFFYNKYEFLKWGNENNIKYTAYPDKPYRRKRQKNIVEPPSNFNKLAVQFLTRRI